MHKHLSRRTMFAAALASVLLLGACGGGSSKTKSTPATTAGGSGISTDTTVGGGGGNGNCFTTPGTQKARVRFVNLFTNSTYPSGDIDVWQGFSGSDPCGKKLATVPFGTASDYIDVTASDESGNWGATGYVAGSTARDHEIISQSETWKGGEQVTIVFQGAEPQPGLAASAGGDQTFFENSSSADGSSLAAVPGKALLAIGAASLQYVVKDGAWRAGIAGRAGCLRSADDTATTATSIGGTSLIAYPVDPGSLKVSLYPADLGTCAGTPDIGPLTIEAAAGSRTLVLAYGPDKQHLKLLALPIAS